MADKKLGVAFSGGGIRSAAFCSGVLRRLITKKREPDFLSCVSGGGYTGSAYVQWKCMHKGKNPDYWVPNFFNHMRTHAGYLCNWQECDWKNCSCGFVDSVIFAALVMFVAVIVPVAGWGSFALPIAFIVNFMYGHFLDGELCRSSANSIECRERTYLFFFSILFFIGFHLLEYFVHSCEDNKNYWKMKEPKAILKLAQFVSGATFAFTFFPWFINDYLQYTDLVVRIAIVALTAVFWFFVPLLRNYSSLVILIYGYSYVVYWHVYKGELLGIKYTDNKFRKSMIASLIMLALFSVLGDFPLRLVHIYNRWRLQKAFYYTDKSHERHEDVEASSVEQCCYCYDIFPGGHCPKWCCLSCICPPESKQESGYNNAPGNRSLTLQDLENMKPQYISNMVVNGWCRENKQKYCLLTMSPEDICVIDKQPSTNAAVDFRNKLKPSDIKLSSAMAMSAAAVSPHLGKHEETERQLTHILTVCGFEMAASMAYDMEGERKEHWVKVVCLYAANFIVLVAISVGVTFGVLEMLKPSFPIKTLSVVTTSSIVGGILACLLFVFLIILSKNMFSRSPEATPSSNPLHRWCTVHMPIYRFVRSMFHILTYGATPPAMMHVSDGGHFENYGLLPLLKLRLPKILLVHGLEMKSDEDYAKDIIVAMEKARQYFHCSFTSMAGNDVLNEIREKYGQDVLSHIGNHECGNDVLNYVRNTLGGDVLTDIKNEYVLPKEGQRPRKYEFKVHYSGEGQNGVSVGHIVLIAPRSPDMSVANTSREHNEYPEWQHQDCEGRPLDDIWGKKYREEWGGGPYLTNDDVKVIEGCPGGFGCCECCHTKASICSRFCFKFPRHPTLSQFFTSRMFAAYHREGYRACMECDDFLENSIPSNDIA